jgi:hypothetical protein
MDDIKFYQTPVQKMLLIARIRQNPSLKEIFKKKKNVTQQINDEIHDRLNGYIDNFFTIFLTGVQGSMKSSCAMTIMKNADPHFNISRIHFQYEPFRGSIQNSAPKEGFQLDESVFTHGMGANRLVQEIQNLIETLRKRQNSLIIVSPEMKYFPENIFTYIIETLDTAILATCPDNPSLHEPRNCTCWHNKNCKIHHCYVRTAIKTQGYYIGFYIIPIDWESKLWKEYSQEKNKFMEEITTGQIHNSDYQQIARDIMEDPEYETYNKNKKTLRLLIERRRPTLTISESDAVATQIKIFEQTGDFE